MSRKRLYNDREISAVLKRAAELQRHGGPGDTSGLSLDELEQIAADVGIDPAFIKAAALELDEQPPGKAFHLMGAPLSVDLERIIDGEMSAAKWEETVAEIRRVFGVVGEVGRVGRSMEWTYRDQAGERMHLTAIPTRGQTKIRLFYKMTDWAVGLHVPVLSVGVTLVILQYILLSLGPVIETGLAIFIFLTLHMLARLVYGAIARRQDRKARKLLSRLDDILAEPEALPAGRIETPAGRDADRVDTSVLSDDAASEPATAPRRRERGRA